MATRRCQRQKVTLYWVNLQWFKDFLQRPKGKGKRYTWQELTLLWWLKFYQWILLWKVAEVRGARLLEANDLVSEDGTAAHNPKNLKQPFTSQFWLPEVSAILPVHLHLPSQNCCSSEDRLCRSSSIIQANTEAVAQLECYISPWGQGESMYQRTAGLYSEECGWP